MEYDWFIDFYLNTFKRKVFTIQIPSHIVEHILETKTERKGHTKKMSLFFSV